MKQHSSKPKPTQRRRLAQTHAADFQSEGKVGSDQHTVRRREPPKSSFAKTYGGKIQSGFSTRNPVNERGIPQYNALDDAHCPYTKSAKFLSDYSRRQREEKLRQQRKSHRLLASGVPSRRREAWQEQSTLSASTSPIRAPKPGLSSVVDENDPLFRTGKGITWADTFEPAESVASQNDTYGDPAVELEVLKAILLREGYAERMRKLLRRPGKISPETIDLLELLRLASVEVVEAIVRWRRGGARAKPFIWNGMNYLLKMMTDLEFVNKSHALTSWLGFHVSRNPFIIPPKYQYAPKVSTATWQAPTAPNDLTVESFGSTRREGVTFGGDTGAEDGVGAGTGALGGGLSREIKGSVASGNVGKPYHTKVVPGLGLREPTHADLLSVGGIGAKSGLSAAAEAADPLSHLGPPPAAGLEDSKAVPSHIGDLDMLRVREAERVMELEEQMHGKWRVTETGSLMPVPVKGSHIGSAGAAEGGAGEGLSPSLPRHRPGRAVAPQSTAQPAGRSNSLASDNSFDAQSFASPPPASPQQQQQQQQQRQASDRGLAAEPSQISNASSAPPAYGIVTQDRSLGDGASHGLASGSMLVEASAGFPEDHPSVAASSKGRPMAGSTREATRVESMPPTSPMQGREEEEGEEEEMPTAEFIAGMADYRATQIGDAATLRVKLGHRGGVEGGRMSEFTSGGTAGRTVVPGRRARGARIGKELAAAKDELAQLTQELMDLRSAIALEEEQGESLAKALYGDSSEHPLLMEGREQAEMELAASQAWLKQQKEVVNLRAANLVAKQRAYERKKAAYRKARADEREAMLALRAKQIEDKVRAPDGGSTLSGEATGVYNDEELWGDDDFLSSDEEEGERRRRVLPVEMEEYEASVHLQRMARGFLGRRRVQHRRVRFNAAGVAIQRIARGFIARRLVDLMARQRYGAMELQRVFRGGQGRAKARQKRRDRVVAEAATCIQRHWRGRIGRERAVIRRLLYQTSELAARSAAELSHDAMLELAALNEVPPYVLSLCQCLALMAAPIAEEAVKIGAGVMESPAEEEAPNPRLAGKDGRDAAGKLSLLLSRRHNTAYVNRMLPPTEAQAQASSATMSLQWPQLRELLITPAFLSRLRRLGRFATRWLLLLPRSRVSAVMTTVEDPDICFKNMLLLPRGADAAYGLLTFTKALAAAADALPQFLSPARIRLAVEAMVEAEKKEEAEEKEQQRRKRLEEAASKRQEIVEAKAREEMYIPPAVLGPCPLRPRPVLVFLARDVPSYASRRIIHALLVNLPGMFVHVDPLSTGDALESNAVAKELDAAMARLRQKAHQQPGAAPSKAGNSLGGVDLDRLQRVIGAGRSGIVRVDAGQAKASRTAFMFAAAAAKRVLTPCPDFVFVQGSAANRGGRGTGGEGRLGIGKFDYAGMAPNDAAIKRLQEIRADCLFALRTSPHATRDLNEIAVIPSPPTQAVLVAEALIVMLSPQYTFQGPNAKVFGTSWKASRKLLMLPAQELANR